jgi:VanZ family protein
MTPDRPEVNQGSGSLAWTGRRLLRWLPPIVYMLAIFLVSAERDPLPVVTAMVWDKLLHGVEYALLAVLLARACLGERLSARTALWVACAVAIGYAATDEIHQAFVDGRHADVGDWTADSIGAVVGAAVYVWTIPVTPSTN